MGFIDRELLPGVFHIEDALGVCFTLVVGRERALLVDAGYGLEDVAAHVRRITSLPVTLWLTHGHHDHAMGARWFDAPRLHPEEASVYAEYTGAKWRRRVLLSARDRGMKPDEARYLAAAMPEPALAAGEALDLGGVTAQVLPTPGHTPGSVVVCVPEKKLLLTGDDWNPCTWVFFPEALGAREYRDNVSALLELPFEQVLCPHSQTLHARRELEAFLDALTDEALDSAPASDTGAPYGVNTREVRVDGGMVLVFDGGKL